MKYVVALLLLGGAGAWVKFMYWVRHRPAFLERGTQHIVFFSSAGMIALLFGAVLVLFG